MPNSGGMTVGLLDRLRRKKEEKNVELGTENKEVITELEKLCGDDKETFEALVNVMFLDPKKIETSMKEAVENAKTFEKAKDLLRARIWYEIAGGLAIYEGNIKKVAEYFGECERLSNMKYPILKDPEKAVTMAQEYYKKYLKS
jgi:hypothetical protein